MNSKTFLGLIFFLLLGMKSHEPVFEIDFKEFAKGHPAPNVEALTQLKNFPNPRYLEGHHLNRNYNWTGVNYLGGELSEREQSVKNTAAIQEELVNNWNYYFHLGNSKKVALAQLKDTLVNHQSMFLKMANEHPEWPISVTTFWPQVSPKHIGEESKQAYILSQKLPEEFYLKGFKSSGRFKTYSYCADSKFIEKDAATQKFYFEEILKKLTRPITIINENGETRPQAPVSVSILEADKCVKKDFEKSKTADWKTYQAEKKLDFRKTYSKEFLSLFDTKPPIFTWYNIDGNEQWHFDWNISKTISSSFDGEKYATTDYYPRWPYNWKKGKGSWKGWSWLERSRKLEIENGDRLFSPFVAAGWDTDPEKNIRPSQWLGLLKSLSVLGADFFYTGFFNLNRKAVANPDNYIWQLAMPSYAQAIASRYQEVLLKGDLLKDEKGNPIFDLLPKEKNVLVTVRKHLEKPVYVIAAAMLPFSNDIGEIEDEKIVEINIANQKLNVNARRQGSVYLLDLSKNDIVFYQLDKWHEAGHPEWWSTDITIEAELFDASTGIQIKTENTSSDFSTLGGNSITYVSGTMPESTLEYIFESSAQLETMNLELKGKGDIQISIDEILVEEFQINNSEEWISKKIESSFQKGKHQLSIRWEGDIQLDRLKIYNEDSSINNESSNHKQ